MSKRKHSQPLADDTHSTTNDQTKRTYVEQEKANNSTNKKSGNSLMPSQHQDNKSEIPLSSVPLSFESQHTIVLGKKVDKTQSSVLLIAEDRLVTKERHKAVENTNKLTENDPEYVSIQLKSICKMTIGSGSSQICIPMTLIVKKGTTVLEALNPLFEKSNAMIDATYIALKDDEKHQNVNLALPDKQRCLNLDYCIQNDLVLHFLSNFGGRTKDLMKWRLYCRKKHYPWPPCDNYFSEEPLNMIPLGDYESDSKGHHCSGCDAASGTYKRENDNSYGNIVVMTFKDSKARIGYNKWMLIHWIANQIQNPNIGIEKLTLPTTRHRITEDIIVTIVNSEPFEEIVCDQLLDV